MSSVTGRQRVYAWSQRDIDRADVCGEGTVAGEDGLGGDVSRC